METFGDRVRSSRKEAGLTQKQLAAKTGLSQTTISDIERGRNGTSAEIVALGRALKVLAEWLGDGRGPRSLEEAKGQTGEHPTMASAQEPTKADDLGQKTIETRAKALAKQAGEVATMWMSLPEDHRNKVLQQLREATDAQTEPGVVLQPRKRRVRLTMYPDTKGRQGAG